MRKPRLLLLDANAVIAALEAGAWDALVAAYDILLPSIVVRTELIFFRDPVTGRQAPVNAPGWVAEGSVREISMGATDLAGVLRRFAEPFVSTLDPGEAEALAYLLLDQDDALRFVSADGWAIQAAAMLDEGHRMMCLSDALNACGHSKALPRHHRPEFLREHLDIGGRRRVTGEGLRD